VAGGDLLDEPSAAALAFAPVVGVAPGEQVLVVDGEGDPDVTVQSHDGRWLQRAVDGDLVLGGDDPEQDLIAHVVARPSRVREVMTTAPSTGALASGPAAKGLERRAEAAFMCTVHHPDTGGAGHWCGPSPGRVRSRDRRPPSPRRRDRRALPSKPDVDRASIRKVLLVGGSSRIPASNRGGGPC
jgi:hypothetical protein